ncbi:MAG TPA: hypothetical protein VIK73_05930 [Limnochordales bacterium]
MANCFATYNKSFHVWRANPVLVRCLQEGGNPRYIYRDEFFAFLFNQGDLALAGCPDIGLNNPRQKLVVFRRGDLKRMDCGWMDLRPFGGAYYGRSILNFALASYTINGQTMRAYQLTRDEELYRPDGSYAFVLPAGTWIATNSDTLGAKYPWRWIVKYRYHDYLHDWIPVITGEPYGWLDTGMQDRGSMATSISIRTSITG